MVRVRRGSKLYVDGLIYSHHKHMRQILLLAPFYSCGYWYREELSNLLK